MSLGLLLLLAVANLVHRLFLLPASPMVFDSWGHLYFTMEVRRAKSGPFGALHPRVPGSAPFHYPLFVHWIYSFLPERWLRHRTAIINPVVESLFLASILALALAAGFDRLTVALSGLLYILTPLWFSKTAFGPRVLNFTSRLASEAAFPLAIAFALWDLGLPDVVALALATFFLAIILLGSKFGVQAVFFLVPPTGLIAGSWLLGAAFALAVLLSWIVSGGAFGKQLRQQAAHLGWYLGELRAGRAMVLRRNNFADLVPRSLRISGMEFKKLAFGWLGRNSFTAVLLKAPHLPLIPVLLLLPHPGLPLGLTVPIAVAALVYFLINLPWLLFLGEAERYLSHLSIFTNLLFVTLCIATGLTLLIYALVAYGLVFSLAERVLLRKPIHPERERDADLAIAYLKSRPDRRMVLPIPFGVVPPFRILVDTDHGAAYSLLSGADHQREMKGLESDLLVDLGQWPLVAERTGADLLVVSAQHLPEAHRNWTPPEGWRRISGEYGALTLYERIG